MNLIQCTCGCRYQKDGYCTLDSAAEVINSTGAKEGCLHFVSDMDSTDLTDVRREGRRNRPL